MKQHRERAMPDTPADDSDYVLDDQIGHLMRRAWQRHTVLFSERMIADLTPTQFAILAKLREIGACSQNDLGRRVAMDAATTKGVIDRLYKRGYLRTDPDPSDGRRLLISLTDEGVALADEIVALGHAITEETLSPLNAQEQKTLIALLRKLT